MRWIVTCCALLTVCVIGMATYEEGGFAPDKWVSSALKKPTLQELMEDENKRHSNEEITLEPYAKKMGATLNQPAHNQMHVDTMLPVAGKITQYQSLSQPYVWIHIKYMGKGGNPDLPDEQDVYAPVKQGQFNEKIRLFQGKGEYRVTLRLPSEEQEDTYYLMASFIAANLNDVVERDVSYSVAAAKAKLKLDEPVMGYSEKREAVSLKGRIRSDVRTVLVQLKRGARETRRVVSVEKGQFEEQIPLTYGQGVHQLKILVPDSKRKGTYLDGATLYVNHPLAEEKEPIRFTRLYAERGIHLTAPLVGGEHADLTYRIAGRIDESAPFAKQTTHMIVRIQKGKDKATYFLPVGGYQFDSKIWLRFGAGEYNVTLYAPEITSQNRDYFRFFTVATFRVTSRAQMDGRDLLPGRGIQSDHPLIVDLAKEITAGKLTDRAKARAIYTYVAKNMTYDMDKFRNNRFSWNDSAIKSLSTRKGVCQDYVFLTLALLRSIDIPSRFVEGEAGGQRHAWVEAKLNGRWVTMDPTWGSGHITPDGRFVKRLDMQFFDPLPDEFKRTHKRTGVSY
ncbi:transglutaminase domain-containing protein [Laceyella sacchari]|uniref:Transglutaminase-like domain-containing protein n=1 Tax=Laceyella sacchari TaxID=37482 RepID=A0ABY5U0J3_LACSH|nr:transglutaminase-like domain-containing protein [Laceyella sacchari]UWE03181.1 transglutaminase-like domain-containing protein [Laceyella sacchari]